MIISADASQLEWRTILELSRDPVGIQEVLQKLDTHSLNQNEFRLPTRLIAKIYLFRTIFRGTGYAFSVDPEFSHVSTSARYWDNVNELFYAKYNGIDKCHIAWKDLVLSGRPISGPLGRSWSINIPRGRNGELKIPWTTLSNHPVQGTGADVMKIARIAFYKKIKQKEIPCDFLTTVHDSIAVDAESKWLEAIAQTFHGAFDSIIPNIRTLFGYEWVVPLACEVKFGNNMKDMQKFA